MKYTLVRQSRVVPNPRQGRNDARYVENSVIGRRSSSGHLLPPAPNHRSPVCLLESSHLNHPISIYAVEAKGLNSMYL